MFSSARRCLWPVDHDDLAATLQKELREMEMEAKTSLGRYEWTAVPGIEVAEFYREKVVRNIPTVPLRDTPVAPVLAQGSEATPVRPGDGPKETQPHRHLPRKDNDEPVVRTPSKRTGYDT